MSAVTQLPALARGADSYVIAERVNELIKDYNSGRVEDLAQALVDIAALQDLHDNDATTFLGANVALNNTANFFNGPNTGSIGASGQKWLIGATATLSDTADAQFTIEIHDGTTGIANTTALLRGNALVTASIQPIAVALSAATTFTLRARDHNTVNGLLRTSASGGTANRATSITAVRLA